MRELTDRNENGAPRRSAGRRIALSGGRRAYAAWILSSKAASAAFAPSPIEMMICL